MVEVIFFSIHFFEAAADLKKASTGDVEVGPQSTQLHGLVFW